MPSITDCKASFPNSRIKPRPPTTLADTGVVNPVVASNGVNTPPTLIRPANANRTYLEIRNIGSVDVAYGYYNRNTLWADGFVLHPGDAVEIDSPQDVYAETTLGAVTGVICWDEGSG